MSNTHDKFLTGSLEKEEAFLRDLSALLNTYGIDNAVNAPDYALANYLHGNLGTLRHTLHMHYFPRGARGYATGAPFPWGPLAEEMAKIDETMELAGKIREQLLEKGRPCYVCHGTGYLVPSAAGAPTLDRWLHSMRDLNEQLSKENTETFKDLQASADAVVEELNAYATKLQGAMGPKQLEIDVTKLSDAEKASILHAYDWSDDAPDNELQRAGRRLMDQTGQPKDTKQNVCKDFPQPPKGGAECCQ